MISRLPTSIRYAFVCLCLIAFFSVMVLLPSTGRSQSPGDVSAPNPVAPDASVCIPGALAGTDPEYNRPFTVSSGTGFGTSGVPGPCAPSGSVTDAAYDAYSFNLTGCTAFPTEVIVTICGSNTPVGSGCATTATTDSVITIYRTGGLDGVGGAVNPFNRGFPCTNAVALNDDLAGGTPTSPGGSTCNQTTGACMTVCSTAPGGTSNSGLRRNLGSGHFVVVVAGFGNTTTGSYNLYVNAPAAGCAVTQQPTAASGLVSGTITDAAGNPVAGTVINLAGSESRKTITNAKGYYQFEEVEPNEFYTVTPSRANYNFSPSSRSFSQLGNHTDAAFSASATADNTNPLDTPEFFVRQQYVDTLGREPDEGGFNYWSNEITKCGADGACVDRRRREVAASFFIEQEFQDTGSFVYGLYKASFGVRPTFAQYQPDRKRVIGGPSLTASRRALADDFVARAAFKQAYPDSMTDQEFVDKLYDTAGLSVSMERVLAVNRMQNGATRSEILEGVIANTQFARAEYNAAFVLTEYFSYLQRNPEPEGYDFWLNVLNNGDVGNYRGMVCSFITSTEYQKRFSSVVTHSNAECGN